MMKKELNENRVREFDEETAKVYEKLLNKIMKKKYNWFDKIDINQLTYSNIPQPYVGIRANIFVDEDWGGNQWREYNYSNSLPSSDEELSFGDIIGGDLAEELRDIFLTVFQMVTGLKIKHISFSWVDTYFVDLIDKNLNNINENKTVPVELKRRLHLIDRLINLMLPNMYPCDYDNEETFVRGVIDEIYWLWHDEDYGVHDLNFGDVSDFILDYKREELSEYYNERCGDNLSEQIKKVLRNYITESDPKVGTGKKPKGSGRRLYTDENPKDTVSVKFRTKQDIIDTLNKSSFKSKSHKRQSQIINLIHQRLRVALERTKDPEVKKRLRTAFEYIVTKKEESKRKTQEMKESELTERCWKGYTQKGMKTMFGKRYPNCVKKTK
jgi:hypothetical protein